MIVLTEVIIDDHKRTPVHSTSDRAFLLSCKECFAYFSHEKVKNAMIKHLAEKEAFSSLEKGEGKRFFDGCYWQSCLPSEYAIQVSSDNSLLPFCEWWLRATEYISEEEIKSNYYLRVKVFLRKAELLVGLRRLMLLHVIGNHQRVCFVIEQLVIP